MLKVFEYQGTGITFDFEGETFINATEMAKPFGKRVHHFLQLKSTIEYLEALLTGGNSASYVKTVEGSNGGTWMHELLALEFAGWLSPSFKVWCNQKIRELLTTGQASVNQMSMEDMMIAQLQASKEQRLRMEAHDMRIGKVESEIKYIQHSKQPRPEYFTVAGYANFAGISINLKMASSIGKRASQYCKVHGIPMDEIPDPRFGYVKMYPKKVLEVIFDEPIN